MSSRSGTALWLSVTYIKDKNKSHKPNWLIACECPSVTTNGLFTRAVRLWNTRFCLSAHAWQEPSLCLLVRGQEQWHRLPFCWGQSAKKKSSPCKRRSCPKHLTWPLGSLGRQLKTELTEICAGDMKPSGEPSSKLSKTPFSAQHLITKIH